MFEWLKLPFMLKDMVEKKSRMICILLLFIFIISLTALIIAIIGISTKNEDSIKINKDQIVMINNQPFIRL